MSHPIVADTKPIPVNLKKGDEYYYCTCGHSSNQPFCDGSHAGTPFTPKSFVAEEDGEAYLCQCKQSGNPPFCDGTHAQLPKDVKGKELEPTNTNPDQMPTAVPTPQEPSVAQIHQLATEGLSKMGHHGPMAAMGVPGHTLQG